MGLLLTATTPPAAGQLLPPVDSETQPPPAPPPRPAWPWGARHASSIDWIDLAVRGSFSRVAGAGAGGSTGAVIVSVEQAYSGTLGAFAYRWRLYGTVGGGGGGLESESDIDLLLGLRGYVAGTHGPFARGGLVAYYLGNDRLGFSYLAPAIDLCGRLARPGPGQHPLRGRRKVSAKAAPLPLAGRALPISR